MPKGKVTKLADVTDVDARTESEVQQETELLDFFDTIGSVGISEVSLYRWLPNGRQKFITGGPPSAFSEQAVQAAYGGGDYLLRSRLNGKWFKSKMFSVENVGGDHLGQGNGGVSGEIERLKLRIQEQETRMEADRQAREQRNHEVMVALIENRSGNANSMTMADVVTTVKSLKEMSGSQDEMYKSIDRFISLSSKFIEMKTGGGGEGGWWDWAKPIVAEAGRQLIPKVLPKVLPMMTPPAAVPTAPVPIVPVPGQAAVIAAEGSPAVAAQPASSPAPSAEASAEELEAQYQFQKKDALIFTLSMARINRSPELWADLAFEQVETASNPVTARFISEINKAENFNAWFADLETLEPTVITQRSWFEVFFKSMRELLSLKATADTESN